MARRAWSPCTRTWSRLWSKLRGSEGREAPIDEQTGARDVRGFLGRQKQHTRGHFLGRTRTFEHGACTGLGTVIVQGFAGGRDAAFVKRRENEQNLENLRRNCYAPIRHGSPCVTSETNVMRPQGAKRCAPSKATFPSMRSPL